MGKWLVSGFITMSVSPRSVRQTPAFLFGALLNEGRRLASHKRETQSSCASRDHSFLQKRSPTRTTRYHIVRFHGILLLRLESNVQIRVLASVPQNHVGDFQGRGRPSGVAPVRFLAEEEQPVADH